MNSLEYWRKREAEQLRKRIADEEERGKAIEKIYAEMRDAIQKQIDAFYGKYAKAEGITIAEAKKRASKLDIEAYARKAKKYVAEKDFTAKANAEMKLYNMTMKVNRLELLKAEIGSELCAGFTELEKEFDADLMSDAVSEMERQAGILGTTISDQVKRARGLVDASFHNATFSDRIWMYQAMLKDELNMLLQEGFVQGRNSKELARHLTKTFGVSASDAERLMRTEMTRVYTAAQHESLTEAGYDQYTFIAEPTACDVCKQLDGKHFPVEDLEKVGEHAPPIHPNCRCSVAAYMDREEFDRWLENNESEERRKKLEEPEKDIDSQIFEAEYRRSFESLGENGKATRSLWKTAQEILTHRRGTSYEDLAYINAKTGKYIINKDYNVKRRAKPNRPMNKLLKDSEAKSIIAVHNHSNNTTPSLGDLVAAEKRGYKYGLIVCHNGKVFKYEILGPIDYNRADFKLDVINDLLYSNKEESAISSAIEELKNYGIGLEVVR